VDQILGGSVKIIQSRRGYRFSEDALHLCRFVKPMTGARGIDLGTGSGIIAIVLLKQDKVSGMVALELQESLAALAERNIILNGLQGRAEVVMGDLRRAEELFTRESFDLVVSNPPYRELGRGRLSVSPEKRAAKHEEACSLKDLVDAASHLLTPGGVFCFCHLEYRWSQIQRFLAEKNLLISRRKQRVSSDEKSTGLLLVEAIKPGRIFPGGKS
jgi:tRNA1Val (adenine37-N6)-methyltransferase